MLLILFAACEPAPPPSLPAEDSKEQPPEALADTASIRMPLSLQWNFDATEAETATIRDLLETFVAEGKAPPARFGVIDRFTTTNAAGRYLLLTTSVDTASDGTLDEVVYVLQGEPPHVSEPWRIGTFGIETSGPTRLGDFDDDALMDIAYCDWDDGNSPGRLKAVGFKNGAWYSIEKLDPEVIDCAEIASNQHGAG